VIWAALAIAVVAFSLALGASLKASRLELEHADALAALNQRVVTLEEDAGLALPLRTRKSV
jgi:hypothetical protein